MATDMRLFIAMELSQPALEHLVMVQEQLRAHVTGVRWTEACNQHLTLRFLGDVRDSQVNDICAALRKIAAEEIFEIQATCVETFPRNGPVRVIAAAIGGNVAPLLAMQAQIETCCAKLGFTPEGRGYVPHVTIGRSRDGVRGLSRQKLAEVTEGLWPGPVSKPEQFHLIQSHLLPQGSKYVKVASFPCQASA